MKSQGDGEAATIGLNHKCDDRLQQDDPYIGTPRLD